MKRFVLKPGLHSVNIPGFGRLTQGMVLEGDEYAVYERTLVQLLDSVQDAPKEQLLVEPLMMPRAEEKSDDYASILLEQPKADERKLEHKEEPHEASKHDKHKHEDHKHDKKKVWKKEE